MRKMILMALAGLVWRKLSTGSFRQVKRPKSWRGLRQDRPGMRSWR